MLKNIGPDALFAGVASPWDRFQIEVERNGVRLQPKPALAAPTTPPPSREGLARGEMQWTDLDLSERYDFTQPGVYRVRVTGRFKPLNAAYFAKFNPTGERIALSANTVTIVVRPNAQFAGGASQIFRSHHPRYETADQIFDAAIGQLSEISYPHYISYIVEARSFVDGRSYDEAYNAVARSNDDSVVTQSKPVWSTNKPENPWGFNINIFGLGKRKNGNIDNPFGTPRISPLYAFGLRRPPGLQLPPDEKSPTPERIKLLGRILTVGRNYTIKLAGIETYASHRSYHLTLKPIDDPDTNRVRDMWIDTDSLVIWGLTSDGIFPQGPASKVRWNVTYGNRDGNWVMVEERTTSALCTGGAAFGWGCKTFNGFDYVLSNFDYPAHVYQSTFFDRGPAEAFQE